MSEVRLSNEGFTAFVQRREVAWLFGADRTLDWIAPQDRIRTERGNDDSRVTISAGRDPREATANLDGLTIRLASTGPMPTTQELDKIAVEQWATAELTLATPQSLVKVFELLAGLQNFLTLALGKAVDIDWLTINADGVTRPFLHVPWEAAPWEFFVYGAI